MGNCKSYETVVILLFNADFFFYFLQKTVRLPEQNISVFNIQYNIVNYNRQVN